MRAITILLGLAMTFALAWFALAPGLDPAAREPGSAWAVGDLLGGDAGSFDRVDGPAAFDFPYDHGPHTGYRHEWWYLTGHLAAADGRRFGFQVTFFRFGLSADGDAGEDASAWRGNAVYMAHFGLTDVAGRRFVAAERFARPALGLAGARAEPFAVWTEGWRLDGTPGHPFPMRLAVDADGTALELTLDPVKPVVAQGVGGTSRKGPEPGNATRYYSLPRLAVAGRLRVDGRELAVTGTAWLDREWGSSALGEGVVGWDWFALQLDDGRDLMLYRLRRADGGVDRFSAGSVIAPDGAVTPLAVDDFAVDVVDRWRSDDGVTYPSRWRVRVAGHGIDVEVVPLLADQELRLAVRYWEGAVDVVGRVGGRGYVELTGYAGVRSGGAPR